MRIELTSSAWKAEVLPLYHIRINMLWLSPMERKTGFEPATLALARRCSTPEPLPQIFSWWRRVDSNHCRLSQRIYSPPPLASRALLLIWSWQRDLNPQPADYKSAALPVELCQHMNYLIKIGDPDRVRTDDLQRDRLAF